MGSDLSKLLTAVTVWSQPPCLETHGSPMHLRAPSKALYRADILCLCCQDRPEPATWRFLESLDRRQSSSGSASVGTGRLQWGTLRAAGTSVSASSDA